MGYEIECYFCRMFKKHLPYLIIIFFLTCQHAIAQQKIFGKVVRISDGDTITILDSLNQQHRVRLHGIDSPEKGQDYYQVAKEYIGQLCFQREVEVSILKYDHYKRAIGKVYIDSTEVNISMLKAGLAWHFLQFDKSEEYALAEAEARLNKRNLWSLKTAQAPWEFRKIKRQQQKLKAK